jgi:[acyl-carrier-protein] S-malonyltransferase
MTEYVFLFDGQGSFRAGVGKELCHKYPEAMGILHRANAVLGYDLIEYLWGAKSDSTVGQTSVAQPAISVISLAYAEVLRGLGIEGAVSLGHSLGEATAIVYCGIVSLTDGIRMIQKRGAVMEAGGKRGTMMAILNIELIRLKVLCDEVSKEISEPVVIANINAPDQIVISGSQEGIRKVAQRVTAKRGRTIPLNLGGAWHSPYLKGAAEDFATFLDEIEFRTPARGFYSVVEQKVMSDPVTIKESMKQQMLRQVNWVTAINNLRARGYSSFLEIGPSKILKDLVSRIDPQTKVDSTALYTELNKLIESR